ncbi:MAG: PEP-CTERM sorting domain-containing protein [Pirellulales bacterium]
MITHRHRLSLMIAVVSALVCLDAIASNVFFEDFNSGTLDPELSSVTPPGFNLSLASADAFFSKDAGTGNGFARIQTNFLVDGDFTATVDVDRMDLGSIGIAAFWTLDLTQFTDIFYYNEHTIIAGSNRPVGSSADFQTTIPIATFQIHRTGSTIGESYNIGSGFTPLFSVTDPSVLGPVRIGLFLGEEDHVTTPISGSFDNFRIVADRFVVPEPSTMLLLVVAAVGIFGRRQRLGYTMPECEFPLR